MVSELSWETTLKNRPHPGRNIKRLLDSVIIRGEAFVSDFFLVRKKNSTKVRPIFNNSHLTSKIKSPHFLLPSLIQLVKRKPCRKNLFYVKLDFASAFLRRRVYNDVQIRPGLLRVESSSNGTLTAALRYAKVSQRGQVLG